MVLEYCLKTQQDKKPSLLFKPETRMIKTERVVLMNLLSPSSDQIKFVKKKI
jgi:hypothetical protein